MRPGLDLGLGPDRTSRLRISDPRWTQSFLSVLIFGRRQVSQVAIYSCSTDTTVHTFRRCRGINELTSMSVGTVGGRARKFHAAVQKIQGLIDQIFGRKRLYAV